MTFEEWWTSDPDCNWRQEALARRAYAAGLERAEALARAKGNSYTKATVMMAHNVVELSARAACNEVADAIHRERTGEGKP